MGTKAADRFNPSWQMWLRSADDKEQAMQLDSRGTTHPIQQKVETEAQAADAFDEITYSKGQSFLRMLESWLGEEKFRDGMRRYMKNTPTGTRRQRTSGQPWVKPVVSLSSRWPRDGRSNRAFRW
jgi:aminopeptidase N